MPDPVDWELRSRQIPRFLADLEQRDPAALRETLKKIDAQELAAVKWFAARFASTTDEAEDAEEAYPERWQQSRGFLSSWTNHHSKAWRSQILAEHQRYLADDESPPHEPPVGHDQDSQPPPVSELPPEEPHPPDPAIETRQNEQEWPGLARQPEQERWPGAFPRSPRPSDSAGLPPAPRQHALLPQQHTLLPRQHTLLPQHGSPRPTGGSPEPEGRREMTEADRMDILFIQELGRRGQQTGTVSEHEMLRRMRQLWMG